MCSKNGENVDMTTLGSTGKTDPSKFDGKKKLFLVPLIPMANLVLEKELTQQEEIFLEKLIQELEKQALMFPT